MKLINAALVFAAGYIYNDHKKNAISPRRYYGGYSGYSFPHRRDPETFPEYFKELAMNKMDILFYGSVRDTWKLSNTQARSRRAIRSKYSAPAYKYERAEFDCRADAERFVDDLKQEIEKYGQVDIAEYYHLAENIGNLNSAQTDSIKSYVDTYYGWTDLEDCDVFLNDVNNYEVSLPDPIPLGSAYHA